MIFLSSHLPCLAVPEAGQKICYRHLHELAKENKVHCISFVNSMETKHLKADDFSFCATASFVQINNLRRILNLALNFLLPLEVAIRCDQRAVSKVNHLLQQGANNEVFLEYEQAAFILPRLKKPVKCTVVFHDVISQSIQRRFETESNLSLKRLFYWAQLKLTLSWEARLAKLIDKAIVLNEKDKALLIDIGFTPSRIEVEYPVVAEQFYAASRERHDPETILFWGAMNRTENEDAVLWFVNSILPIILEKIPNIKFIVLGANPTEAVRKLESRNIKVTGFVDNPIPYFETAALAVAPLRHGAGVKLKVLEALAARLPVVGTSVAAEGVKATANELDIHDNEREFAHAVIERIANLGHT